MRARRGILAFFLTPAFSVMFFVALVPFIIAIFFSFIDYNIMYPRPPKFIAFENFVELGSDPRFLNALRNTGVYVFLSVSLEFILGLPLSYFIYMVAKKVKLRNLILVLITFPMMLPRVTSGLLWRFLYNPLFGPINYFLNLIGLQPTAPLSDPSKALYAIVFVDIWQWTPFMILIFLSALEALPESLFDAAAIDGASDFQKFWYLAVPMLRPIFAMAIMFRTIDALRTFDTIYVMTGGGPGIATETVDIFAYLIGISQGGRISYASAASLILLAISVIISNILVRVLYREDKEEARA